MKPFRVVSPTSHNTAKPEQPPLQWLADPLYHPSFVLKSCFSGRNIKLYGMN